MKNSIIAVLMSWFFVSGACAEDENFHIYLAFGQSNMEGTGAIDEGDKIVSKRIQVLQNFTCPNLKREYGQWYTGAPPLFGCWGNLGVADYFARTLLESAPKNVRIGIVPAAVGGSDIALFQKAAPIGKGKAGPEKVPEQFSGGYAWLLDLAQRAQRDGVIKGFIFHQGETNTADPKWKHQVLEVVSDLRKDLNLSDVPFLAGELLPTSVGSCCGIHNAEIALLPELIPGAYVISSEGLSGSDTAHFDAASYREFGRRYGVKMLEVQGMRSKATEPPKPNGKTAKVH